METRRYLDAGASPQVLDRDGKLLCAFLNDEQQWQFSRPLAEISPYLIKATIAAEDQRFWRHFGVDPYAVARAGMSSLYEDDRLTFEIEVDRRGKYAAVNLASGS